MFGRTILDFVHPAILGLVRDNGRRLEAEHALRESEELWVYYSELLAGA